jgi:thiol:disulfide interchange protein
LIHEVLPMLDIVFLALGVSAFGLFTLYARLIARI